MTRAVVTDARNVAGLALIGAMPIMFAIVVMATVGRYGFSPADEGLVQDYALHMLAGQVPHLAFISTRPVGSSILHLPTLLAGGAWIIQERFIAAVEFAVASLALTVVMLRERPARIGPAVIAATAAAAAINLHTFPLMAWYTVDGLVLVAVGYALVLAGVRSGSRWRVLAGLFLIGVATTTKQSFAPAVLIGLVVAFEGRRRWVRSTRADIVAALVAAALAPASYILAVSAAGGASELVAQATSVDKQFLLAPLTDLASRRMELVVAIGAMLIVVAIVAQRRPSTWSRHLPVVTTVVASLAVVFLPLLLSDVLWYGSGWGWAPFWFCLVACIGQWIATRRPDPGAFMVLSAAWMASLSLGAPYPNLVAGSLTLLTLMRLWESVPLPHVSTLAVRVGVGLGAAAVLAVVLIARTDSVYRDLPASQLTADLTGVSPALAGVVTNPTTAAYLEQIKTCVARFPASRVAILPDGAGAYSALGLHPALPIDWLWPPDYQGSAGSRAMIVAAAAELRRDGDALVLWQSFDTGGLANMATLPRATLASRPYDHDPLLGAQIRSAIGGFNDTCGSFLVRYVPAGSGGSP
ncbi:MAG: hypothetical protein ACHQZR_03465 [Candidatus Limnocylindrales bacterium]